MSYDPAISRPKRKPSEASLLESPPTDEVSPITGKEMQDIFFTRTTSTGAAEPLAKKDDSGKEPLSLLSFIWLRGVASVLGFGAKKYAAHNWRKGIPRSRLISAALRHILAYSEGEDLDPESGLSHLDHAACCIMFARETHETHPQLDDRWKGK